MGKTVGLSLARIGLLFVAVIITIALIALYVATAIWIWQYAVGHPVLLEAAGRVLLAITFVILLCSILPGTSSGRRYYIPG
ncbi:MAG: hypothetical protein HGA36_00700 [Candidatus Moranbacteria bacterium]|nr:hypothetical protein [Candidatus Moranbacteria bacterium]